MSSKALHVEIEVGAVLGFHVAGKDVVVDADAFAVGEGYGDDGLGTGGGAKGGGEDGEGVVIAGLGDELGEDVCKVEGRGLACVIWLFISIGGDGEVEGKVASWVVGLF